MMSPKSTTVFFGSGPVAARSLELLLAHQTVEYVITKPRPAHHHGPVPVLAVAEQHQLPVLTAVSRSELDSVVLGHNFTSDHAILIDFGIIVSQNVIDHFPKGIINSHFSLLPHLRGADPITWAIADGEAKTGVSLMLVDAGMDTGKLITQKSLPLATNETAASLTTRLIDLSDQLLQTYLPRYLLGEIKPKNQPHPDRATYSRKLTKADGVIDWHQPAVRIEHQIRAFADWPKSHASIGDTAVIINKTRISERKSVAPGQITATKKQLWVGTADYDLEILALTPAGKNAMPIAAFLAGHSLSAQ